MTVASCASRARSSGSVDGVEVGRRAEAEGELRGVEHLHRQPAPDLHLRLVERRVRAGPGARCTPAHRVGAVRLEDLRRHDDVALGLAHLLAVRDRRRSRRSRRAPTATTPCSRWLRTHGREQPGADDVVRLRAQVHGEHAAEQVVVAAPATRDLRRQRRRRPGVHDVRVADEAAGLSALRLVVPGGQSVDGSTGQRGVVSRDRGGVVRRAVSGRPGTRPGSARRRSAAG